MSDIRFNKWLHQSGTGGVSQSEGGHVGIGTTNPLIPVGSGNTSILNVGVTRTYTVAIGAGNNRTHTGVRCPNMNGSHSDTSNAPHYSEITLMEVVVSWWLLRY